MRKRRYAIKRVCSVVLTVSLLSGCQWGGNRGEETPVLDTTGKAEAAGAAMLSGNLPDGDGELETTGFQAESYEPADWMQGGFQMPQVWQGYRESVCVNTYVLDIPEPDFEYTEKYIQQYTSLGGDFYVLDKYGPGGGEEEDPGERYQLYWLDGDTGESRVVTPYWEGLGTEERIQEINAVGDHLLALLCADTEGKYRRILWDLESGETDICDMTRAMELGVSFFHFWMDARGSVYALSLTDGYLYVFGEKDVAGEGEMLYKIQAENPTSTGIYCRMADGTPLVHMDGKLVYLDVDAGEARELAQVGGFCFYEGCIDERGNFYQVWNPQINVWNPATGDYNFMLDLRDYGLASRGKFQGIQIGVNRAGELMVLTENEDKLMVYCFGSGKGETEGTLRLANLWLHDSSMKSAANAYSAQNPDCQVSYETDWENGEGFYERVMAQMAVGKGPDLLFVSTQDMERLNTRGLLADLSEVLEEETGRQLFCGVTTAGLRDGRLLGLPAGVSGVSMITVDGNWQGDGWTLEEIVELWRQRRKQGASRFLPPRWSQEEMLDFLVLQNMADSPFLDWENHTCDFGGDLFRQVLEMIGEVPVREHKNLDMEEENEIARQVMDGTYLADVVYGGSIAQYASIMERYEGEARLVGLPAETGDGNMLTCYGFIVVNAGTEHWEEAADFLRFIYDRRFQSQYPGGLLRRDVLRESVVLSDEDGKYETDQLTGISLPLKKDGGSYVEDYLAFMDSCRAEPRSAEAVKNIMREEAGGFFQNIQSLENTVRAIQNRVQLYLNENS